MGYEAFPVEFALFGAALLGIALFHRHSLAIALVGLIAVSSYKTLVSGFHEGTGVDGLLRHFGHEWVLLANLLGMLLGFALLAHHFEESRLPAALARRLPKDWRGGILMLLLVFLLSGFVDNIAGAMIGGTLAHRVYKGRVHLGFLVGVVVASNAGGAGSIVGDTTTTMIWLAGASPLHLAGAYVPAFVAALLCAVPAARQQAAYAAMVDMEPGETSPDVPRLLVVALMLLAVVGANVAVSIYFPMRAHRFPYIGVALWMVILLSVFVRGHDWGILPGALKDAVFLLALVTSASLMPVERLPDASWATTLGLGIVSAFFDNIPLTALAIKQGGYDWALLAYAVGFGGSLLWFGSTAGVALCSRFPEGKSMKTWLRHGWYVLPAYLIGFFVMLAIFGWQPTPMGNSSSPSMAHP